MGIGWTTPHGKRADRVAFGVDLSVVHAVPTSSSVLGVFRCHPSTPGAEYGTTAPFNVTVPRFSDPAGTCPFKVNVHVRASRTICWSAATSCCGVDGWMTPASPVEGSSPCPAFATA